MNKSYEKTRSDAFLASFNNQNVPAAPSKTLSPEDDALSYLAKVLVQAYLKKKGYGNQNKQN